jgi:hypothetical protein
VSPIKKLLPFLGHATTDVTGFCISREGNTEQTIFEEKFTENKGEKICHLKRHQNLGKGILIVNCWYIHN